MFIKKSKMRAALSLALCAALLFTMNAPAFGAQKISNPGNFGHIDGIDSDPSVGIHNSYAWCAEMFAQTDGDYLWVGMNRDMGWTLLGGAASAGDEALAAIVDMIGSDARLPEPSEDRAGKIYRQKAADNDSPWEMVYENPAINGYRRMIIFKGYLYVCAGLTNIPDYDYSVILRFSPDFKLGDTPEIVMWEDLPRNSNNAIAAMEYFRAACVFEDKLYIGTFDSKIYVTDGESLESLTPKLGEKHSGWELFADLKQHPDFQGITEGPLTNMTYIWDLIGFKGSIYAVVTYWGFNLFKITPRPGGEPDIKQIVGGDNAKYPNGMGLKGLVSASPFVVSYDKDYVYMTTFANGPFLLGSFGQGDIKTAFETLFCPASIFRFDENDNWDVVVGDKSGKYAARDKEGKALPVVGNQRAGFYTGADYKENTSFNQYIWWMAEYEGKLYASTWDYGIFKRQTQTLVLLNLLGTVAGVGDGKLLEILGPILGDILGLDAAYAQPAAASRAETGAIGLSAVMESILSFFRTFITTLRIMAALAPYMGSTVFSLLAQVPALLSLLKYYEFTNPTGFDLFVSEDGKSFSPVTVNGYGNESNYGGRVLLPTGYGLFVCTANPFGGGQVWRTDDIKPEMHINAPAKINLANGGQTTVSLRTLALPAGTEPTLEFSGGIATASLVKRGGTTTVYDYNNQITLEADGTYVETYTRDTYPSDMYDIVITGAASGTEAVTVTVTAGGVSVTKNILLNVY